MKTFPRKLTTICVYWKIILECCSSEFFNEWTYKLVNNSSLFFILSSTHSFLDKSQGFCCIKHVNHWEVEVNMNREYLACNYFAAGIRLLITESSITHLWQLFNIFVDFFFLVYICSDTQFKHIFKIFRKKIKSKLFPLFLLE